MAIYHLSAQVIGRSAGRSAVAAAAYRAGEKIKDERLGMTFDYSARHIDEKMILAPSHSPAWVFDRCRLWNEVEKVERRKDSQLCREINIAIPRELSIADQSRLVREYVQSQFVDQGMIADIAIHRDKPENPHAHIMLTMREISSEGFGKKNREWNDVSNLETWRKEWAECANRFLERAGENTRIDHRSFERQGITDRLPTVHDGPYVRQLESRGIRTDRGDINRSVKEHNAAVVSLAKYREEKKRLRGQIGGKTQVEALKTKLADMKQAILAIEKQIEQVDQECALYHRQQRLHSEAYELQLEIRRMQDEGSVFFGMFNTKRAAIREAQQRFDAITKEMNTLNPPSDQDYALMQDRRVELNRERTELKEKYYALEKMIERLENAGQERRTEFRDHTQRSILFDAFGVAMKAARNVERKEAMEANRRRKAQKKKDDRTR